VVSIGVTPSQGSAFSGMRPINLATDLAQLADLIEIAFADSMDSGGRAALREMRLMSRVGAGLTVVSRLNEMALGVNMGYVWIENGKLVGNVSIYPANWPRELGSAWIIANVAVHPDYRRQGIARQLMNASLEMLQLRGGKIAILQVDADNDRAQALYSRLGFRPERNWTTWRRTAGTRSPLPVDLRGQESDNVTISNRQAGEWRTEYALARSVRPAERGGIGWLRPLHPSLFRRGFTRWINDLLNLKSIERLVVRQPETRQLLASLWIERGLGSTTQLTLLNPPDLSQVYLEALLSSAIRRFEHRAISIEHPEDDTVVLNLLQRYRFHRQRSIMHMRWDA
jgi:ribosomal protein S18 acetylase RimI-like enzyme